MSQESRPAMWSATRPPRAELRAWAGSICAALLLHAGVVAALLVDFGFGDAEPISPPLAAMTVELAVLPSAPEQRVTEMPPGPEQVEQKIQPRPQPRPRTFDPPPAIETPPPPDALAAEPEEEPEPEQTAAADRTTAAPSAIAETSEQLQAPVEGSASNSASSTTQTWENRLLTHLERYKRYPGMAQQRRQEDVVYLRFTMDRSGRVLNWNIERSRGYALLDREVNALIQRASPLPAPPDEVAGASIEMVVPVEFFLSRNVARVERR